MQYRTDDLRVLGIRELVQPVDVLREYPLSEKAAKTTYETRQAIHRILHGADDRILVVIGPCSIHDVTAAREYAGKLKEVKDRLAADLIVVMGVNFEEARTTGGRKGLIKDPFIAGHFSVHDEQRMGSQMLIGLTEYVDTSDPQ